MLVTLGKKNCHAIAYEMEMVRYCVVTWPCNAASDTVSRCGREATASVSHQTV